MTTFKLLAKRPLSKSLISEISKIKIALTEIEQKLDPSRLTPPGAIGPEPVRRYVMDLETMCEDSYAMLRKLLTTDAKDY